MKRLAPPDALFHSKCHAVHVASLFGALIQLKDHQTPRPLVKQPILSVNFDISKKIDFLSHVHSTFPTPYQLQSKRRNDQSSPINIRSSIHIVYKRPSMSIIPTLFFLLHHLSYIYLPLLPSSMHIRSHNPLFFSQSTISHYITITFKVKFITNLSLIGLTSRYILGSPSGSHRTAIV